MQDYAALEEEINQLRLHVACAGVSLVRSSEPWNPIAAVVLHAVEMPEGIHPRMVDMRIPIPNLYGFAVSVGIAVVPVLLQEELDDGRVPVPFCVATEGSTLGKQKPYYVDVRENYEDLLTGYSVCVSPTTLPDRFYHIPLYRIVGYMLEYLRAPTKSVREEQARYYAELETDGPSTFLLMSIAHSHEGLREYERALEVLESALALFPGVTWIAKKAEHIRSLM